jgi:hypothetical protein
MTVTELQRVIRAADPAAVLVSARVLERVIQQACRLPALVWVVPHGKSWVVDRQLLFRHVEQDDLNLEADQLLPPRVILLSEPTLEELNEPAGTVLLEYWRRLFHASIHLRLEERFGAGELTLGDVRTRIEKIGQTEFEEIRNVLVQDAALPSSADERAVYVEFAALFLELRYFAANLLPAYFPGIRDMEGVEGMLAQDVEAARLFERTRLEGAPTPVVRTPGSSDEAHEYYWRLVRSADRAARAGNLVRSAILRTEAARVAPVAFSPGTRADAEADLKRLTVRLQRALQLPDAEAAQLHADLVKLLDKADQGRQPVEAAILYDLQKVCLDHEREIYTLDLVEWLLSGGKRPVKRPLPGLKLVRVYGHLRSAVQRLTMARLSDVDRQHLNDLLQKALVGSEERLRERFRPVLSAVLEDVGLRPRNPPEAVAFRKLVEELLDRIKDYGFLTFGDLRDAISRNQLKLPDLADPQEFLRGDALARLDRRLSSLMDGVYRPSEIYMRGLERLTSLGFGTVKGRLLTRYALIPFGAALFLLEGVRLLVHLVGGPELPTIGLYLTLLLTGGSHPGAAPVRLAAARPGAAPQLVAWKPGPAAADQAPAAKPGPPAELPAAQVKPFRPARPPTAEAVALPGAEYMTAWSVAAAFLSFLLLGFFLLALLHSERLRQRLAGVGLVFYRATRLLLVDIPLRLLSVPWLRRLARSWPTYLLYWWLLKPLVFSALLWLLVPVTARTVWAAVVTFLAVNVLLNSRTGQALTEAVFQGLVRFVQLLGSGLLTGLVHWILRVFKGITDAVEYVLFSVDEWLRFRRGDSRAAMVVRSVLAVFWFPVSYVARFYFVVLIEPCVNPIKLPLSILAAKFVYPVLAVMGLFYLDEHNRPRSPLVPLLAPYVGSAAAWLLVIGTFYLLPDAFAFLVWELKENWRLYRANRPRALRPVALGTHGETVRRLLQPGFHSGTIPRLYARLRAAERRAYRSGSWRPVRANLQSIEEVAEAVRRFVERELLSLLRESAAWRDQPLKVGRVALATNRILVELAHTEHPEAPFSLELKVRAGWLVAGVRERGWLDRLGPERLLTLLAGLVYLYKLAGVHLVREQVRAGLPGAIVSYDITAAGLVLWLDQRHTHAVVYDLVSPARELEPRTLEGRVADGWPDLDARRIVFARVPLSWADWVQTWEKALQGPGYPVLPCSELDATLLGHVARPALAAVASGQADVLANGPGHAPELPRERTPLESWMGTAPKPPDRP